MFRISGRQGRSGAPHRTKSNIPDAAEVLAELDRILGNALFNTSNRLSALLRFTVEAILAGRREELKEPVIGVEVFGKDPSYSTREDPVVRVMSGRLRSKLAEYYQGDGKSDPVIIELPRGGYVPSFRRRDEIHGQTSTILLRSKSKRSLVIAACAMWVVVIVAGCAAMVLTNRFRLHPRHAIRRPQRTGLCLVKN